MNDQCRTRWIRFSHLHLLVKRSRRNNRDSLAATEIPRRFSLALSLSFSISLSFFSFPPRFLSLVRARSVISFSFTSNRVSRHAYEWNCFAASRKNVTLLNDSRLFIAAVNQHHPCYHPRGEASRDDNSKLVPGVPFGPFVRSRFRFEEWHTYSPPLSPMLVHQNKSATLPT